MQQTPPPETPPPATEPAPTQPAEPTIPPAEAPTVPGDVDIPAPGTSPAGS